MGGLPWHRVSSATSPSDGGGVHSAVPRKLRCSAGARRRASLGNAHRGARLSIKSPVGQAQFLSIRSQALDLMDALPSSFVMMTKAQRAEVIRRFGASDGQRRTNRKSADFSEPRTLVSPSRGC